MKYEIKRDDRTGMDGMRYYIADAQTGKQFGVGRYATEQQARTDAKRRGLRVISATGHRRTG